MGLFKKQEDPIEERARLLNAEIAALEARIKSLNDPQSEVEPKPRMRSTALPHGPTISAGAAPNPPAPSTGSANPFNASKTSQQPSSPESQKRPEPVFESLDHNRLKNQIETTDKHYNDLGMRKYDLLGLFGRIKRFFQGPTHSNPKLVNLLAAGSVQGLRSLRYEKRIARNRFIGVVVFVILILLMAFAMRKS